MHHPWIFVRQNGCEGSWDNGWQAHLPGDSLLPGPVELVRAAGEHDGAGARLGVLLEDALLHPLRITLETRAPRAELPRFLAWKLKRYLPFSADAAEIRSLPLPEENTYLTFSLPRQWTTRLAEGFAANGAHCGYIGGAFSALLENVPDFRGRASIALFDDFYVYASLDGKGRYLDYRLRRLPLATDGSEGLDLETLARGDWQPLAERADEALLFCDLRGQTTSEPAATLGRLEVPLEQRHPTGSVLERFIAWSGGAA